MDLPTTTRRTSPSRLNHSVGHTLKPLEIGVFLYHLHIKKKIFSSLRSSMTLLRRYNASTSRRHLRYCKGCYMNKLLYMCVSSLRGSKANRFRLINCAYSCYSIVTSLSYVIVDDYLIRDMNLGNP